MKLQLQAVIMFLSLLGNLVLLPQANGSFNGYLTVRVDGLKNQKGQVCFTIFSGNKGFPSNGKLAVRAKCIKISEIPLTVTFPDLKAGNYAIAIFHDANGDGILNRNALGIPTESFGFSNNPKILTGPPTFSQSAVLVAGPSTDIQIQLQYFLGG